MMPLRWPTMQDTGNYRTSKDIFNYHLKDSKVFVGGIRSWGDRSSLKLGEPHFVSVGSRGFTQQSICPQQTI